MVLLRRYIGGVLRDYRNERNLTLHEVAEPARVSKGYLSEVERGMKEASSEVLSAVAAALDVNLSEIVREASLRIAVTESSVDGLIARVPDAVPADLVAEYGSELV